VTHKELSLLKAVNATLSPAMMAIPRELKIARVAQNIKQTNNGH
jgi:hypothetical protein